MENQIPYFLKVLQKTSLGWSAEHLCPLQGLWAGSGDPSKKSLKPLPEAFKKSHSAVLGERMKCRQEVALRTVPVRASCSSAQLVWSGQTFYSMQTFWANLPVSYLGEHQLQAELLLGRWQQPTSWPISAVLSVLWGRGRALGIPTETLFLVPWSHAIWCGSRAAGTLTDESYQ